MSITSTTFLLHIDIYKYYLSFTEWDPKGLSCRLIPYRNITSHWGPSFILVPLFRPFLTLVVLPRKTHDGLHDTKDPGVTLRHVLRRDPTCTTSLFLSVVNKYRKCMVVNLRMGFPSFEKV